MIWIKYIEISICLTDLFIIFVISSQAFHTVSLSTMSKSSFLIMRSSQGIVVVIVAVLGIPCIRATSPNIVPGPTVPISLIKNHCITVSY